MRSFCIFLNNCTEKMKMRKDIRRPMKKTLLSKKKVNGKNVNKYTRYVGKLTIESKPH